MANKNRKLDGIQSAMKSIPESKGFKNYKAQKEERAKEIQAIKDREQRIRDKAPEMLKALKDMFLEMQSIRASYFCDPINTFAMDKAESLINEIEGK